MIMARNSRNAVVVLVSKPYLEKVHSSQLSPGADTSLNPYVECYYCKDTGQLGRGLKKAIMLRSVLPLSTIR